MSLPGKLLRSPLTLSRIVLDTLVWPAWLRTQGVETGPGLELRGCPRLRRVAQGRVWLGQNVRLLSRPGTNPLQQRPWCCLALLKEGASIEIGDDSALTGVTVCAAESVVIGRRVLIGADATIMDTDFHPLSPEARREHQTRGAATAPVVVGDDVFIGMGAILLKGTRIGAGSVVGAGAVVSGTFPERVIIAGNPAKVVRPLDGRKG